MEKVMVFFVSDCCGVESNVDHEICSRCGEHCEIITETYENVSPSNSGNTDDGYDAMKDSWVLGDEPMTSSQRREQESWDETCRQNGW